MRLRRLAAFVTLICLLFLVSAWVAQASDQVEKTELEKVRERLRDTLQDEASLGKLTLPADTSQRFIVKEVHISGNSLVSTADLLEGLPLIYTVSDKKDGVTVEAIYDFRSLRDIILDPGPEREVSLKTIQGFTKYLLSVYQEKGYAGIYVYLPADAVVGQTRLVNGILPVRVLEGKVAKLTIERYDFDRQEREKGFLKDSVLESWSPVQVGEAIQKRKLDNFLKLLNLNPDRYVSAVISRSAEPNALNLTYDVYESNPWHWYIQVDNAGTKDRQWAPRLGVVNTDLTGIDDRFSALYQAPWEKGIEDEYAVFGSYNLPVFSPRLRLNFYAGYSEFDIPGLTGINFLGNGSFYGSGLSYSIFQMGSWFVDVTGSVSRESSKVTPSLGIASDVDMDLWGLGIDVHRSIDTSETSLVLNRVESMGGSSNAEFQRARIGSDPDFSIYNVAAAHSLYLDASKVNRLSGSMRYIEPDGRLVPAKMTTFGGLYSVRGYEEDEIVADGGMIISGQYEFDLVKHFEPVKDQKANSAAKPGQSLELTKLAPLAFIDCGRAKIEDPLASEQRTRELCSIGAGVIIKLGVNFTAGMYYGWPLRGTDETDRGDGRFNVSLIYRF
jgi:hemolysin activation/secretion protein